MLKRKRETIDGADGPHPSAEKKKMKKKMQEKKLSRKAKYTARRKHQSSLGRHLSLTVRNELVNAMLTDLKRLVRSSSYENDLKKTSVNDVVRWDVRSLEFLWTYSIHRCGDLATALEAQRTVCLILGKLYTNWKSEMLDMGPIPAHSQYTSPWNLSRRLLHIIESPDATEVFKLYESGKDIAPHEGSLKKARALRLAIFALQGNWVAFKSLTLEQLSRELSTPCEANIVEIAVPTTNVTQPGNSPPTITGQTPEVLASKDITNISKSVPGSSWCLDYGGDVVIEDGAMLEKHIHVNPDPPIVSSTKKLSTQQGPLESTFEPPTPGVTACESDKQQECKCDREFKARELERSRRFELEERRLALQERRLKLEKAEIRQFKRQFDQFSIFFDEVVKILRIQADALVRRQEKRSAFDPTPPSI